MGSLICEWRELWDRCPDATPFQRPEWLVPYARHFGVEPLAVALRRGRRLAGLVLGQIAQESGERVLRLLGAGVTDHLDVLLEDPADAAELLDALIECARCDRADLDDLGATSAVLAWRPAAALRSGFSPVLDLAAGAEAVPQQRRDELKYLRRRAARNWGVRFETASRETLRELMQALFTLHEARWRERGETGVLAHPAVRAFHQEAAAALLDAGLLRLYALRLDGHIAAVHYGFAGHRRASYYLGGFDPALDKLSPGTLVVGHAIEQAIAEGCLEFDFLRGREPYKYRWGARDRARFSVCLQLNTKTVGGAR
jgi:CelD/BcsL family acetyltransferase involved in cellulose biosynthesis